MKDPYDPEALRLSPDKVMAIGREPKGRTSKRRARLTGPRLTGPFLLAPLAAVKTGCKVLKGPKQMAVWLHLLHLTRVEQSNTVKITNRALEGWGVDRAQKYRALRLLAKAGLVTVDWRERRNPTVTLVADWQSVADRTRGVG
jgi:hypothetical protein